MLLRIMLLLSIIAIAGGCGTIRNNKITWEFEQSSKGYNKMIRWNELDKADAIFPPERLREEFREKVREAKGVKVTDFRIKSMECSPEKGEATVIMEIDYYREPSVTLKTVEDRQKWEYVTEENDSGRWRLMTMPPEFK